MMGSTETAYGRELKATNTIEPTRSSLKQKIYVTADDSGFDKMPLRVRAYERDLKDSSDNVPMIATDFPHIHSNHLRNSLTSGGSSSKAGAVLLLPNSSKHFQPPP